MKGREIYNLIQQTAAAIVSVFQSGATSQKTTLKELKKAGAKYGMWDSITDEDIENADDGTDAGFDETTMPPPPQQPEQEEGAPNGQGE